MSIQATKSNVLQQFVERANSLYSLPAVAVEVLDLTDRTNIDTAALRECVERDPVLTAKLLRVVNSSMFGLSREVSDLNQALTLLGVKPLKLLVLGFSLPRELYQGVEVETLQRFWKFTLVKAVAARELSRAFWGRPGDEAFIAGLLQEIGILVLVKELGDTYISFLGSVHTRGEDLLALEASTLGFDHAILSARLLDHWSLPAQIVDTVAAPQKIDILSALDSHEAVLPQALHLATMIASIIVSQRSALLPELLEAAKRYRGIRGEQIDEVLDELQGQVQLMSSLFSVTIKDEDSYRQIMARAHAQMSDAAMDALPQMMGTHNADVRGHQQALSTALDQYAHGFFTAPASSAPELDSRREAGKRTPRRDDALTLRPQQATADPGLHGRIAVAIQNCGTRRRELSLALFEIDNYENLLVMFGPEGLTRVIRGVRRAIQSLADVPCESLIVSDTRVAAILPESDRHQAVQLARSLNEAIPVFLVEQGDAEVCIAFSIGISSLATPSRRSRPSDLIDAADRCLFAARGTSSSVIKSIDVL